MSLSVGVNSVAINPQNQIFDSAYRHLLNPCRRLAFNHAYRQKPKWQPSSRASDPHSYAGHQSAPS